MTTEKTAEAEPAPSSGSGGDAVASTDGGVFTVANNGKGTMALGTESGEVQLTGGGHVVIVRAGQQSIVRPGEAPSQPVPIPNSLRKMRPRLCAAAAIR